MRQVTAYSSSGLYAGRLFVQTVLQAMLLAALVEAIFLSERSISILRMVIDEPIGLANAVPLLAWTSPEIYLALPLVVLIGVYQVILRCRERLEFIALSSGGQSTLALVGSTVAVALVGFACSLLVSGAVYPYAQYAFRVDGDYVRYQALRAGGPSGRFVQVPGYTVYTFPSGPDQTKRPIFVKQDGDNTYRIIDADRAELVGGPRPGWITVRLIGTVVNEFGSLDRPPAAGGGGAPVACNGCEAGVSSLRTQNLSRPLDLKNVVHIDSRGKTLDEWMTPELLGWTAPPGGHVMDRDAAAAAAVRRFARALLCFLAPFAAWVTLAFTTRRSLIFALPAACVTLMVGDIAFSQSISLLGVDSVAMPILALSALSLAAAGVAVWRILARQHFIVFPALARS